MYLKFIFLLVIVGVFMITKEELYKIVNSIKSSDIFLREGTDEFNELKFKAERDDIISEFLYGEQLYYNEKYLDSIYWICKSFNKYICF